MVHRRNIVVRLMPRERYPIIGAPQNLQGRIAMRITDAMVYTRSLQQVENQFNALDQASAQVSTGQRNATISDDPVAGGQVMQIDAATRGVTQYLRNISSVQTGLSGEESTLNQLTDLLSRAKELATEQAGSNGDAQTRAAAGAEVSQLLAQAVSLGNLKIGDQYVFAGTATDAEPFQADGSYVGNTAQRQAEIGNGVTVNTTHTGAQLFVDSGAMQSLTALQNALNSNDSNAILASMTGLDTAFDATQNNLADVGARTDALTSATNAFTAQQTSLSTARSNAADIPIEEASLNLASIQTALQAGLLATSKILNTSLVNYLQ
jgi:flagellar hook-associated protein 3 FlgL